MSNRIGTALLIMAMHVPTILFTCASCYCVDHGHTGFGITYMVIAALYVCGVKVNIK